MEQIKKAIGSADPLRDLAALAKIDLHTHSSFCDGACSPEELVRGAIDKGLDTLGIVVHSYVDFDPECSVEYAKIPEFIGEIARLREKYSGKIKLLAGLEEDYYTTRAGSGYDYKIGSVHYLKLGGEYLALDLSRELLCDIVNRHFGGDFYSLCREYYRLVGEIAEKTGADIVGHIDLITKFNEGGCLFDTESPRYVEAYRGAVDRLIRSGAIFEINVGAISRGYRRTPYPERQIFDYIKKQGGRFILSGDAHSTEGIGYNTEALGEYFKNPD